MNSNNNTDKHNKRLLSSTTRLIQEPVENLCITARQLQGLSLEVAECYGKPHINARYLRDNVDAYEHWGSCAVCGERATNAHHCPPKGKGRNFLLMTEWGRFVLKPALLAVCGSGTTGCHGAIHQRRITPRWVWYDQEYARQWWNGELLKDIPPHSERLYSFGEWEFIHG